MKSFITRPALLLACVLGLSACGGKATFEIGGTLVDSLGTPSTDVVKYDSLVLKNGSDTVTVPKGTGKFSFPHRVEYGEVYNVEIASNPPHQNCAVGTGKTGTAGQFASINVLVTCSVQTHLVNITLNQAADGLVLVNGSSNLTFAGGATTGVFIVAYGNPYGVTVLTQPTNGKTCTVQNGVGTMGDADISNVTVTCA